MNGIPVLADRGRNPVAHVREREEAFFSARR
jgi:hypothetical protein